MTDVKLWLLSSSAWNYLPECKQMINSKYYYLTEFNSVPKNVFTNIDIYI